MTPSTPTELASRESGNIAVALFWNESTDEVLVTVADASSGASFALEIATPARWTPSTTRTPTRPASAFPSRNPLDAAACGELLDVAEAVL